MDSSAADLGPGSSLETIQSPGGHSRHDVTAPSLISNGTRSPLDQADPRPTPPEGEIATGKQLQGQPPSPDVAFPTSLAAPLARGCLATGSPRQPQSGSKRRRSGATSDSRPHRDSATPSRSAALFVRPAPDLPGRRGLAASITTIDSLIAATQSLTELILLLTCCFQWPRLHVICYPVEETMVRKWAVFPVGHHPTQPTGCREQPRGAWPSPRPKRAS